MPLTRAQAQTPKRPASESMQQISGARKKRKIAEPSIRTDADELAYETPHQSPAKAIEDDASGPTTPKLEFDEQQSLVTRWLEEDLGSRRLERGLDGPIYTEPKRGGAASVTSNKRRLTAAFKQNDIHTDEEAPTTPKHVHSRSKAYHLLEESITPEDYPPVSLAKDNKTPIRYNTGHKKPEKPVLYSPDRITFPWQTPTSMTESSAFAANTGASPSTRQPNALVKQADTAEVDNVSDGGDTVADDLTDPDLIRTYDNCKWYTKPDAISRPSTPGTSEMQYQIDQQVRQQGGNRSQLQLPSPETPKQSPYKFKSGAQYTPSRPPPSVGSFASVITRESFVSESTNWGNEDVQGSKATRFVREAAPEPETPELGVEVEPTAPGNENVANDFDTRSIATSGAAGSPGKAYGLFSESEGSRPSTLGAAGCDFSKVHDRDDEVASDGGSAVVDDMEPREMLDLAERNAERDFPEWSYYPTTFRHARIGELRASEDR